MPDYGKQHRSGDWDKSLSSGGGDKLRLSKRKADGFTSVLIG